VRRGGWSAWAIRPRSAGSRAARWGGPAPRRRRRVRHRADPVRCRRGRRPAWTWARPTGGAGVALWLRADDAQALHDKLAAAGVRIVTAPADGPFGWQFAFADPEGYLITVHDLA